MGVGGVFDEWAGLIKICPAWIDRIGMKWLWRVIHEPWRWKRIVRVWLFGLLVVYHKLID
jgi:N-acetylglucosaminyldiphosphoundecaprenol N-acetyl-beta-D-mannosaminyltransferase